MKDLALLGLQNDGKHLTLNDAEGNRYSLAITDELRALMRHDVTHKNTKDSHARSVTPREIQAYVRAGKTVAEISELTATPPSQIETLAHPIINERTYTARRARSLPTTRDPGALTLEELVATRLASRGVKSEDIEWDAVRDNGEPWTVIARYESAERERSAIWHVDLVKRSLEAVSEEAVWLSETPLLPHSDVWRAPNTPPLKEENSSSASVSSLPSTASTPSTPSAPSPEQTSDTEPVPVSRIDAVLADLDARRGIPTDNEHYTSLIEGDSETIESSSSTDSVDNRDSAHKDARETIFDLPVHSDDADSTPHHTNRERESSPTTSDTRSENSRDVNLFSSSTSDADTSAVSTPSTDSDESTQSQKKIRRSDRPSMPTWDEIVFGKKD